MRRRTKLILAPFLLLALLVGLFHTPPVQHWLSNTFMGFLQHALGVNISWTSFRLTLVPPRLSLTDVQITDLGTVKSIRISTGLNPWNLRATVDQMRLHIVTGEESKPVGLKLPRFAHLQRVTLLNSYVQFNEKKVPLEIDAFGVSLVNGKLDVRAVEWSVEDYGPLTASVACDMKGDEHLLYVRDLHIHTKNANLLGQATLNTKTGKINLSFQATGEIGTYADHFRLGVPLQGETNIHGKLTAQTDVFDITATIRSEDIFFNGHSMGPVRSECSIHKERGTKILDIKASVREADFHLIYDLGDPVQGHMVVQAGSMSVQRVFTLFNLPEVVARQAAPATLDYRWTGTEVDSGEGKIRIGDETSSLQFAGTLEGFSRLHGQMRLQTRMGWIVLDGAFPLSGSEPIRASGNLKTVRIETILAMIGPHLGEPIPLAGSLQGKILLEGTWDDPVLNFEGHVSDVSYPPFELGSGSVRLRISESGLKIISEQFELGGGSLQINGFIPFDASPIRLSLMSEMFPVPAPVDLAVTSIGVLQVDGDSWSYAGHLSEGRIEGLELENLSAEARYQDDRLDVEIDRMTLLEGSARGIVQLQGDVVSTTLTAEQVHLPSTPFTTSFSLSLVLENDIMTLAGGGTIDGDMPHVLPAAYKVLLTEGRGTYDLTLANGGGLSGNADISRLPDIDLSGTLSGLSPDFLSKITPFQPLKALEARFDLTLNTETLSEGKGSAEIQPFGFTYHDQTFTLPEGLRFRMEGGEFTIEQVPLDHPYGLLGIGGTIRIEPELSLEANVTGYFGDDLIQILLPESSFLGEGFINLTFTWRKGSLMAEGSAEMSGRHFRYPPFNLHARHVDVALDLSGRKVTLTRATAEMEQGTISLDGYLITGPTLAPETVNIHMKGARVPIHFVSGLEGTTDLDLRLLTIEGQSQLIGDIQVTRALYTRPFNFSQEVLNSLLKKKMIRTAKRLPKINMNIKVTSPDSLEVRNNLITARGGGNLQISGTMDNPTIFGRIVIQEGGIVDFNEVKYEIVNAVADFNNPIQIDPVINVLLETSIKNYTVRVQISGRTAYLHTQFSSEPYLPKSDILQLLFGGIQSGQEGFIGGFFATEISKEISEQANLLFGLTRVSIDPIVGGDTVSTARVTVSKQINRNCIFNYVFTTSSNREDLISVECSIGYGAYINLLREPDGSYFFEIHRRLRF
ncbi:MAG TPA: translocation/assembly module TamB domain-containing protein [Thermoanaerobaculia bacterium]|nr:translocation/assembly module TamB domain-containing protein [Thermoanaerobaculia bacterium]HUM28512.1 translocation/assembly module TamB domain-containing protein [Thermoanaerobaculia bacterium]HXK66880.1 translocation/assembly module TamB domain-containing protein [Thermoanaerobaculia bacterium]